MVESLRHSRPDFAGSSLQANTHFHLLVPEGLFTPPSLETEETATFLPLPPPEDEDAFPEGALQSLQAASIQRRLPLPRNDERPPPRKRRCAVLEGFSLHANTHTHANDRHNLERLCRYGARGPLALERLSFRDDGRLAYRLKRPAPDGSTHLVLTPLELQVGQKSGRARGER